MMRMSDSISDRKSNNILNLYDLHAFSCLLVWGHLHVGCCCLGPQEMERPCWWVAPICLLYWFHKNVLVWENGPWMASECNKSQSIPLFFHLLTMKRQWTYGPTLLPWFDHFYSHIAANVHVIGWPVYWGTPWDSPGSLETINKQFMVSRLPGVSQGVPQYTGHPMTCTLAAIWLWKWSNHGNSVGP